MTTKKGDPNTFPRYNRDFDKEVGDTIRITAADKAIIKERAGLNTPVKVEWSGQKSLGNTDINGAKKNVKDIVVFGDGDMFKLLSKASSENEGWMKSTKVMDVGIGCVIQVTTQQRNIDLTYAVAEALTFVPGVKLMDNAAGRKVVPI